LRVDHIDGLQDPSAYINRLRERIGGAYTVTEKVLSADETLPRTWRADGTTGYDFLNRLNGLFCDSKRASDFDRLYARFSGMEPDEAPSFAATAYESKRFILEHYMISETEMLKRLTRVVRLAIEADDSAAAEQHFAREPHPGGEKYPAGEPRAGDDQLRQALTEVLSRFPIYRTYGDHAGISARDAAIWREAIDAASLARPELRPAVGTLRDLFELYAEDRASGVTEDLLRAYFMRLQQYTGPVMAKGLEDTAFYRYNRLISLNEVGGNPANFGTDLEDFHSFNRDRLAAWPHSMSAVSTHDTKRGEDARARINVLSEMPAEWEARVKTWRRLNEKHAANLGGAIYPDPNLEYLLYQSLVGAWTAEEADSADFVERMKGFALKAAREAKVHTRWDVTSPEHERALESFVEAILDESRSADFLADFREFMAGITHYGILNSLSQMLLMIAAPGVPDIYQGCELWNLSLVDPDNRRPVDFSRRETYLEQITEALAGDRLEAIAGLLASPTDGRMKLLLTQLGLKARKENIAVFTEGSYIPIESSGKLRRHVIAFARSHGSGKVIAIAPRLMTGVVEVGKMPLGEGVWGDTEFKLAGELSDGTEPSRWLNAITGEVLAAEGTLRLGRVLKHFPVALLLS
jgi:(1->4)-alpha-D-glucan 1-alpha-D-glucosylmutase